jgi:hypothetical protein
MNHLDCSSCIITIASYRKRKRRRKSFFPTAFFFLFVSAYNHLSSLYLDGREGEKKEKNECNSIVKLSAVSLGIYVCVRTLAHLIVGRHFFFLFFFSSSLSSRLSSLCLSLSLLQQAGFQLLSLSLSTTTTHTAIAS